MKFFDADFWKCCGATVGGFATSGYAAAREVTESVAVRTPTTGYDVAIARLTALALCLYLCAKFILLVKNRNKKEED